MQGAKQPFGYRILAQYLWNDHHYKQKPKHDRMYALPLSSGHQRVKEGKSNTSSRGYSGEEEQVHKLILGRREDVCQGERQEKWLQRLCERRIANWNKVQRTSGKADRQSGDTGMERNELHLINSQVIHAGYPCSSSYQAETIMLWLQKPREQRWRAWRPGSVIHVPVSWDRVLPKWLKT